MRKWLAQHPAAAWAAFAAVLCVSAILIWRSRKGPPLVADVVRVYFYDLNTKDLFAGPSTGIPPIQAPSDHSGAEPFKGARAYVFSCGDCGKPADRTVGWLELYSPEAKKKLEPMFGPNRGPGGPASPEELPHLFSVGDHLVADSFGEKWVDTNSPEAMQIRKNAQKPCDSGERPKECRP